MNQQGLIKKIPDNKFGKYYLTTDNYLARKGSEFCRRFSQHFIGRNLVDIEKSFCYDYFYYKDHIIDDIKKSLSSNSRSHPKNNGTSELRSENIDDLIFQLQINEIASVIGAYITYILIQSISPYLWRPRINNIPIDIKSEGKIRDKATEAWGRSTIDPQMLSKILHNTIYKWDWLKNSIFFKRILMNFSQLEFVKYGQSKGTLIEGPNLADFLSWARKRGNALTRDEIEIINEEIRFYRETYKELEDKNYRDTTNPYWSWYEVVDESVYEKLMSAFKNVFPSHYEKFETIRQDLYTDYQR